MTQKSHTLDDLLSAPENEDLKVERARESESALTDARARCREQSHQLLEAYDKLTKATDGSLSHAEAEGQFENALDGLKRILRDFGVYLAYPIFQQSEQDYRQRNPTTQIPSNHFGTLIEFDVTSYEPEELYYHGERDLEKVPLSEDRGWKLAVAMTALPPELVIAIEDMPFKMSLKTGKSGYRCEKELYDVIGRLVEPFVAGTNQPIIFVPDQEDLEFLARAYLDEAIGGDHHYFLTGACDSSTYGFRMLIRFEEVAKVLGEARRQEIIDAKDEREARSFGDQWQAFKSTWDDFWSTPADREAILRLAATMPDDLSELDIGAGYYDVLEKARGGKKVEEHNIRDNESDILDPVVPDEKMNGT